MNTVAQAPGETGKSERPKEDEKGAPIPPPSETKSTLISPDQMETSITKSKAKPDTPASKTVEAVKPAPKQPGPAAKKEPPAVPKEVVAPARAAITAKAIPARAADPAAAKAETTPEIVYARFLKEMSQLSARDLNKLKNEVSDLAARSEYKLAKNFCADAAKDVELAIEYELNALKAIAAAGGMVDLNEEAAKKFGAKQGKLSGFDPARGLSVVVGPVTISLNASQLPLGDILKASPDGTALAQVRYRTIKGDLEGARSLLNALKGADHDKWDQRLRLQNSAAEFELLAAEEFKVLEKEHQQKHWQNILKLVPEFEKAFATTLAFTENVAKLAEWKKDATSALSPPEGMETTGMWEPLKLPLFNSCSVNTQNEPAFGTKFIRVTGTVAEGQDKAAAVRAATEPLNLASATELHFNLRNRAVEPLKVAVVFTREGQIFESPAVELPPSSYKEVVLWVKSQEFKQVLNPDQNYDKPLPAGFAPEKIVFVFYTADAV